MSHGTVTAPGELREEEMAWDPLAQFRDWFARAAESGEILPEAMTLATLGPDGFPSSRIVLLKDHDERGFSFYTNFGSPKATQLDAHPKASVVFWWKILARQLRIEGTVSRLDDETADAYFETRPRGSQLGAWASPQSEVIESRAHLDARFAEIEERFGGRDVPRPPFWGGYRLEAIRFEFWQSAGDRLHDRIEYVPDEAGGWLRRRLAP